MIGTRPEAVALPEPSDDRLSGSRFVRPFRTISADDVAIVGGKNASLGEMYRALGNVGVLVPNGFAVTADAYRYVLDRADAWPALHAALDDLDPHDVAGAQARLVAFDFDERDPGVMEMLRMAVAGAKRNGRYVGICGQAPSDYPEVARFLIDLKIDSISLNPDSILRTIATLAQAAADER